MRIFRGNKQWLAPLAFSRDGRYLAASGDPSSPGNRLLQVWDTAGGDSPVRTWESRFTNRFAFTPDDRIFLDLFGSGLRLDIPSGGTVEDAFPDQFRASALSPDGRYILGADVRDRRTLRLRALAWRPDRWEAVWEKELPFDIRITGERGFSRLLFSSDSARLVRVYPREGSMANSFAHGVQVFAADTGESVTEWVGELPYDSGAGVGPGAAAVVLLRDRAFFAIDATTRDAPAVKRRNANPKHFTDLAFSPDGRSLATTNNDTTVTIWDTATWNPARSYEWKIGRLRSVCFAPDGLRCAAGSDTGQAVVWDLDD
jgi:WD40 repeat protein